MKSSAQIREEMKKLRKKLRDLKVKLKEAIVYEEQHPSDPVEEQEAIMRLQLSLHKAPEWKVGDEGYTVFVLGNLSCPKLKIGSIFKDKYSGKPACHVGPYGPGIPTILLEEMYADPLAAIADLYFKAKDPELTDIHKLGLILSDISKEEMIRIIREWYFETKERMEKKKNKK